ncbi:exopolyphosphatase [Saccharopolyspora spinosa]|uniref:Exopolyphosphatase/guanosine-5'-triphosphate, 3'-diphosphate pyrophosphatase n=1 Tax=Saccharopolyspora spinosa TaxID=60894 RepID=A0A2N3XZT1_SACSN|nr:exopolyphosphatase [Saccharopolyspora spinosa]PKW16178.1 exopolyphosphatase/guanosine-5'-triphosphate,3'-diphosphate pyrophosphatase [Saccharopolyspora spinosa]
MTQHSRRPTGKAVGRRRVAAIDCGTNSIRMLVADLGADGHLTEVAKRFDIVRLGQGVDEHGSISRESFERARAVLAEYAGIITTASVERVRMCTTWISRRVSNSDEFRTLVQETLGCAPEGITSDEEARLAFAGATSGLPQASYLVADIGGGSTQLALGTAGITDRSVSVGLGCVRLTERHLRSDPPASGELAAVQDEITALADQALAELPDLSGTRLLGVSEAVGTVAAIAFPGRRLHHARMTYDQVDYVTERVLGMSFAQRQALPGIHTGMADVLPVSALGVRAVMRCARATELIISEHDILHGIAYSLR